MSAFGAGQSVQSVEAEVSVVHTGLHLHAFCGYDLAKPPASEVTAGSSHQLLEKALPVTSLTRLWSKVPHMLKSLRQ